MTTPEFILIVVNAPSLIGILAWIVRVETRLTSIETTCKIRNQVCDAEVK